MVLTKVVPCVLPAFLIPRFLRLNIPFDGFRANFSGSADEIGSGPQRRHSRQFWKFSSQYVCCSSFNILHDIRYWKLWKRTDKQMHMIDVAFHCENFNLMLFTDCCCQFFKSLLHAINQKDLSSIAWAEYKMVVDQWYSGWCCFVLCIHAFIIATSVYKVKRNIHKDTKK